ncbi:hypothetical protein [Bradyrhizobium zhanjiangense]|uniref:hypothetical protein n=1 Tax=Bradyrhizobium zhanjiangense TaxID=1325107 RepID=UPI0013E8D8E3|nr:hypothetical protein [Bradyrhizobium zhanjiangense]
MAAMVEALWCEPNFTGRNEVDGIARQLVVMDHVRSADILFFYRADDRVDPFGLAGRTS